MKKVTALLVTPAILLSSLSFSFAENTSTCSSWVESSYENVFQTSLPTEKTKITLVMAQNEYEAAQIVLKSSVPFTMRGVTFSDLSIPETQHAISAQNITYNPIGYEYLPTSSSGITTSIRPENGYCPEWLLNQQSIEVPADTAQPLWVTFYVPKLQTPGIYQGSATVQTTQGDLIVPIELEVCNVEIPDGNTAQLNFYFWQATAGWYNKPQSQDQIQQYYGNEYVRYSPAWWNLMAVFADSCKRNRNNFFTVPTVNLLFDGGTTLNEDGSYTFNWSRFDKLVSFMLEKGWVKRLVGNQLVYRDSWGAPYLAYVIGRDSAGNAVAQNVAIDSSQAGQWYTQFIPALKQHLSEKFLADGLTTWCDIWEQTVADEPYSEQNSQAWVSVHQYLQTYAPDMFVQEALQTTAYLQNYEGKTDCWIPQLDILANNRAYFSQRKSAGDQVWFYTCLAPTGGYLNRFTDQPVWMGRSLMWLVYQYDVDGYLHWGWNAWHYQKPKNPYGDCYSVWPDVENGTITETIRLAANRDGAEEYKLLKILEQQNPAAAQSVCDSVVRSATGYTTNTASLMQARERLIRLAAGENPDLNTALPVVPDLSKDDLQLWSAVGGSWQKAQSAEEKWVYRQTAPTGEAVLVTGDAQ